MCGGGRGQKRGNGQWINLPSGMSQSIRAPASGYLDCVLMILVKQTSCGGCPPLPLVPTVVPRLAWLLPVHYVGMLRLLALPDPLRQYMTRSAVTNQLSLCDSRPYYHHIASNTNEWATTSTRGHYMSVALLNYDATPSVDIHSLWPRKAHDNHYQSFGWSPTVIHL